MHRIFPIHVWGTIGTYELYMTCLRSKGCLTEGIVFFYQSKQILIWSLHYAKVRRFDAQPRKINEKSQTKESGQKMMMNILRLFHMTDLIWPTRYFEFDQNKMIDKG